MRDDFLNEMREAPPPAFARALRERLRALDEAADERRIAAWRPAPAYLILAAVLLVAGPLAFPSVREAARAFLDLFRDKSVAEVRFDPSRVEELREQIGNRSPASLMLGEPEVLQDPGVPVTYPTPRDAAAATGLVVGVPASLPAGMALERVEVSGVGRARMSVDREKLHLTFDLLDLREVRVPRRLAEGSLELHRPRMVSLHYASAEGQARLMESESPTLTLRPGFDLALFGEIGLRVLGVEAEEAHRLAGSMDWGSTLVVPMPMDATWFREITVHGEKGLLVSGRPAATNEGRAEHTVLWSEAGRLHALTGTLSADDLLHLAESVR